MNKTCKTCKNEKDIKEFNKDKYTKDGYTSSCKYCRSHRYKLKCEFCGEEFNSSHSTQKFCSTKCRGLSNVGENNPSWKNSKIKFNCDNCNKESSQFSSDYNRTNKHFCSKKCSYDYLKGENATNYKGGRVTFYCDFCGSEHNQKPSDYNKNKFHYCSSDCMGKHRAIINLGKDNPNYKYGGIEFNCDCCGVKCSTSNYQYESSKNHFCSVKCSATYYAPLRSGENAWNWNSNLTNEQRIINRDYQEYETWRVSVYKRDDYTCQRCGKHGGELEAHHLDGYNWAIEKRLDIDNGITLCEHCHKEFHKIHGYGNNNSKQYLNFINNKHNESA